MLIEKAIVPLDGSATAEVVLPYAEEFLGSTASELILVFVKDPYDKRSDNMLQSYLEGVTNRVKTNAMQYLKKPGIREFKVTTRILIGDPAEELVKFVEQNQNSQITIASHGHSGRGTRWPLGSVADQVANATDVPMLLIRSEIDRPAIRPKGHFHHILAPLDGSRESEASLPYVIEKALIYNAEVTLLGVLFFTMSGDGSATPEHPKMIEKKADVAKYLSKQVEFLEGKGVSAEYIVRETSSSIADEINQFTRDNIMDIVIMSTQGALGLRRWMMGSVTNRVLREGNTPLLLIRPFRK